MEQALRIPALVEGYDLQGWRQADLQAFFNA